MRLFLVMALLVGVTGCGSATPAPTPKASEAPKVTSGKQATGLSVQEAGH